MFTLCMLTSKFRFHYPMIVIVSIIRWPRPLGVYSPINLSRIQQSNFFLMIAVPLAVLLQTKSQSIWSPQKTDFVSVGH